MITTTPFHERLEELEHHEAVGPLVQLPVGHPLLLLGEARVLRGPQQRRLLRRSPLYQYGIPVKTPSGSSAA